MFRTCFIGIASSYYFEATWFLSVNILIFLKLLKYRYDFVANVGKYFIRWHYYTLAYIPFIFKLWLLSHCISFASMLSVFSNIHIFIKFSAVFYFHMMALLWVAHKDDHSDTVYSRMKVFISADLGHTYIYGGLRSRA